MDLADDFDLSGDENHNSDRLEIEWLGLNALRETRNLASNGKVVHTYADALLLGKQLAPKIYDSPSTLIGRDKDSSVVREYRQRAEAIFQVHGVKVNVLEVLNADIAELEILVKTEGGKRELAKRLTQLRSARLQLMPQKYTENQLLVRDTKEAKRDIPNPPYHEGRFTQLDLGNGRGLRICMLHPDPPEHAMGADLVYETYWESKKLARVCAVQYKIWDGKTLYLSQSKNLEEQLEKLSTAFCRAGMCQPAARDSSHINYRLPFCAAFLRPTDQLQNPDSKLISSGLHIPVCAVANAWRATRHGGKKIEKKDIRCQSLSHAVFEELNNTNMIGSRWISYKEIEDFYVKYKIEKPGNHILIHAQEYDI